MTGAQKAREKVERDELAVHTGAGLFWGFSTLLTILIFRGSHGSLPRESWKTTGKF